MTLDELFEHGKHFAKHAFEVQGYLCPMWLVETSDGKHFPVLMPFSSRDDKLRAIEALKEFLQDKKAVRYVSMVEAWTKTFDDTEEANRLMEAGPLSEHHDKDEIIYVIAEDKHHSRSGIFRIIRPEGKDPYLSDFEAHPDNVTSEGTFTHLLESAEAIN